MLIDANLISLCFLWIYFIHTQWQMTKKYDQTFISNEHFMKAFGHMPEQSCTDMQQLEIRVPCSNTFKAKVVGYILQTYIHLNRVTGAYCMWTDNNTIQMPCQHSHMALCSNTLIWPLYVLMHEITHTWTQHAHQLHTQEIFWYKITSETL